MAIEFAKENNVERKRKNSKVTCKTRLRYNLNWKIDQSSPNIKSINFVFPNYYKTRIAVHFNMKVPLLFYQGI